MARAYLRPDVVGFKSAYAISNKNDLVAGALLMGSGSWTVLGGGNGGCGVGGLLSAPALGDGQILVRNSTTVYGKHIYARAASPIQINKSALLVTNGYDASVVSGLAFKLYRQNTELGSVSTSGTDHWFRFQLVGSALKAKHWANGGQEGGSWDIEVTDANYSSGLIGMGSSNYTMTVYPIGVDYGSTNPPTAGGLATISGNVKRDGSNQAGATVYLARTTADMAYPLLPGIDMMKATTDANGAFSFSLDTDDTGPYTISASYKSGTVWYQGAVVAEAGDSGLVIEIHPAHVTRARYKGAWHTDVWDKVGGVWVKR